ncbi:MAG: hypothetical protein KY464_18295 [Gemmatimonadetes bacterium]|nr:hypothetical protein [Gemmatimonadota bacterium]
MRSRRRGTPPLLLAVLCIAGGLLSNSPLQAQQRSVSPAPGDTSVLEISPRGALLRSFALPGWGQMYARAPGRGAVYFGFEAASLWMVYKTSRQLTASRQRDRWVREVNDTPDEPPSPLTRSRAQQFEDWVTLAVTVALFSGADAYVTAQLSDFTDQVRVRPAAGNSLEVGFGLQVGGVR